MTLKEVCPKFLPYLITLFPFLHSAMIRELRPSRNLNEAFKYVSEKPKHSICIALRKKGEIPTLSQ